MVSEDINKIKHAALGCSFGSLRESYAFSLLLLACLTNCVVCDRSSGSCNPPRHKKNLPKAVAYCVCKTF